MVSYPSHIVGTLVNMPGTLVKIQVPSTPAKHKHEAPSSKIFILGAIVQRWNGPLSRVLYRMFLMPPCIFWGTEFYVYAPTDRMRALSLTESTSACVAILTRDPAGTLLRLTTTAPWAWVLWHWSSRDYLSLCDPRGDKALSSVSIQLTEWGSVSKNPFKVYPFVFVLNFLKTNTVT